jgi:hypothetical protein
MAETNGVAAVNKLTSLMLTALFIVMTAITGFTATHLISQVDDIQRNVSILATEIQVQKEAQKERDVRLTNIESFIYGHQQH